LFLLIVAFVLLPAESYTFDFARETTSDHIDAICVFDCVWCAAFVVEKVDLLVLVLLDDNLFFVDFVGISLVI
jgi:hypothetical protein